MPKDGYKFLISMMLMTLAVLAVITALSVSTLASRQGGADPLPEVAYKSLSALLDEEEAEATPMVSPMTGKPTDAEVAAATPKAVRAIVSPAGQCLWILTRTGHLRACEDQSDWRTLPTEVDRGQLSRGSPPD